MIDGTAALLALALAYGVAAIVSRVFFGDAHEGFRILYHRIASAEYVPSDVEPDKPSKGLGSQIAFVAIISLILLVSFPCARYWLGKFMP
ncbi:hypothetical protein [Opitutus terrae]|uniref:Uncharacterized protein n=1 Tax=Opitutus terrae (strain DSM 11246 / JCM 15787 / PB90-1) TaxID=452637 RepID=B1ZZ07_OPITP|nr:hypothetical protein [Opitutus terrae]ACB76330.1 hypothetical protein Oter_3050 [Opitutus terrae PB90-1]